MKNPFKALLFFTRRERRGIILLIVIITLVYLFGWFYSTPQDIPTEDDIQRHHAEYEKFRAAISQIRQEEYGGNRPAYSPKTVPTPILSPFNPNSADSATFRRLGLPAWMARNILNYRKAGGKFRRTEDFRKVYGLTEDQYQQLAPYIYIAPEDTQRVMAASLYTPPPSPPADSLLKYPEGTLVDLNTADTTELKRIPGIGSFIAGMIVDYRQRLGGFYHIEQLREIHLDHTRLQDWFLIRPEEIQRLNLNRASVSRLRNHPYINFYQAKAIVEYRKKRGPLHNLKPFLLYEEFTEADLERISHYVCLILI